MGRLTLKIDIDKKVCYRQKQKKFLGMENPHKSLIDHDQQETSTIRFSTVAGG